MAKPPVDYFEASNRYGRYAVPVSSRHRAAAKRISAGQVYEQETIEYLATQFPELSVVHAGAYFGDFLPALSQSRRGAAKVFAFEPNSENFWCAQKTVEMNGLTNVELRRCGLSNRNGNSDLEVTAPDGRARGGNSTFTLSGDVLAVERVPVARLDDLLPAEERIGVIHLDVEDHERRALAGAMATIARWRPILILESVPRAAWMNRNLAPLGYLHRQKLSTNAIYVSEIPAGDE